MRIRVLTLVFLCAGLALAQSPSVSSGGVLNGASFTTGQPITPGSLVSIFGTSFASKNSEADTIPLSKSLGGVSVLFVNGGTALSAPMLFASGTQLNLQVPWEIVPAGATADVKVIVSDSGVNSNTVHVSVGPASPGVFASNGQAIAVNSDGTLAWPVGAVPGLTTHPAKIGDTVIVYATGLGAVASPPADGENSLDAIRKTLVTPQVMIGGVSAEVSFSGLSPQFVGVNQLNVKVPNVAPGASLPFQILLGGITTTDSVTMAVSQ